MDARRRHPRFLLPDAWCGTLCLSEDVTLDEIGNRELSVLSQSPAQTGEELTLALPGGPGADLSVVVLDSTPVVTDAGLRHRLRFRVQSVHHPADNTKDSPGLSAEQSGDPGSVTGLSGSEGDA